jgi:ABC-type sugar transport system ATPase subunit
MIEVQGLSKRYGTHLAVSDVNFSIQKGEVIGFLGPNGAGKSTIMNILTGYLSLTQGNVKIDGFDIVENPEEAKKRIGYLPEIPPLYIDMKVREYLNFIYDLKKVKFPKKAHIDEIMKLIKIEGGRINVYEPQMLTTDEEVVAGEALVLDGGMLTKCATTTKPTFVALASVKPTTETPIVEVAVGRVESNQIYEVECTAVPTLGTKVTISDGKKVTATTNDGVAEIVDVNGATAAGDTVLVRFA